VCPWPTNSTYNRHLKCFRSISVCDLFSILQSTIDIRTQTCDIRRSRIIRFFNHEENLLFHLRLYSRRRWPEVRKQQTLPNDGGICIAVSSAVIQSNTNWRSAQVQVLTYPSYRSARPTAGFNVAALKHRIHKVRTTMQIILPSIQTQSRDMRFAASTVLFGRFRIGLPQHFVSENLSDFPTVGSTMFTSMRTTDQRTVRLGR
jgi:hypothetical protein